MSDEGHSLEAGAPKGAGVLPFEPEKYIGYVEDCELTEAQKHEFLAALWSVMAAFVRLGFAADSVLPALFQEASSGEGNALQETIPTHEFNVASEDEAGKQEE